jgi:hypothetical protein
MGLIRIVKMGKQIKFLSVFGVNKKIQGKSWLGREDSNLRVPLPKSGALGHLATPQRILLRIAGT